MTDQKKRGFAALTPERRREIAKMGADAVTKSGARYQWTSEKAKEAGRKGGLRSQEAHRAAQESGESGEPS